MLTTPKIRHLPAHITVSSVQTIQMIVFNKKSIQISALHKECIASTHVKEKKPRVKSKLKLRYIFFLIKVITFHLISHLSYR